MRSTTKLFLQATALSVTMLFAAGEVSAATFNLTAQRMSATAPDGTTVPMWGYCQTGSTCPTPVTGTWAPGPTLVVATGDSLTINLSNTLPVSTSIVILGQLGGGLGSPNKDASPAHNNLQPLTWPVAGGPGDPTFTPPVQGQRARSFSPEAGAYTGTRQYDWSSLKPGTYLYETGTHPSLQAPMGLYGVLIVTTAPNTATTPLTPGNAYPLVQYDSDVALLFSEIDPVQNAAVDKAAVAGTNEYLTWTADPASACNTGTSCYPPAVNYNPKYFLINGHAFDQTAPVNSAFPAAISASGFKTGNILMRFVNAGLHTHIPTVVGLPMSLVAEDGNLAPGNPKVQSEVLLTAGKTYDVVVNPPQGKDATSGNTVYVRATFPVFDRALSLSSNNQPNGGMQGFLQVAGGSLPAAVIPAAVNDSYSVPLGSMIFAANVLSNDIAISNPQILGYGPANGTVKLNADGTFTYTPTGTTFSGDKFAYYGNGNTSLSATVTLTAGSTYGTAPTANADTYTSNVDPSLGLKVSANGVLGNDIDPSGYALQAALVSGTVSPGLILVLNPDGSFTAKPTAGAGTYQFSYKATNAQGSMSGPAVVTLNFAAASNLKVSVVDAKTRVALAGQDYNWVIEEDRTFHNPKTVSTVAAPAPKILGTNFHTSYMPVVASGCTGPISCGTDSQTINGVLIPKAAADAVVTTPDQVVLDPNTYYYISVLPSDVTNTDPAIPNSGHTMGGATITPTDLAAASTSTIQVLAPPTPLKPAQLSIFVFEDNSPTNGDIDSAEESQGLGGFSVTLWDAAGRSGDPAGQMTYDVYNMPLTNALFKLDPVNCPGLTNATTTANAIGVIYTCPENDINGNPSPLAGHALIQNVNPGRFDVMTHPGAERANRGETWIQVSTLEGTPANDAFAKVAEPRYFQEFGPPGFHAFVGFVNPDHLRQTQALLCTPPALCPNTVKGRVTNLHMSRPSATELFDSNSNAVLSASTCYVGLNSQNGTAANISFAKCDPDGNFSFAGIPDGTYQVVVWDQWLDQILEYKSVTVPNTTTAAHVTDMGNVPVFSWFTNIELNAFIDSPPYNGVKDPGEPGISQIPMTIRYRDGSISNISLTDSTGDGSINELFPLFNWYVAESDTTRFAGTKVSAVVDGGGKVDSSGTYAGILSSTYPTRDSSIYDGQIGHQPAFSGDTLTLGLQGFISQTNIINWGKRPYNVGENGGIAGMVIYTSTRGFDDPRLEVQFNWEPAVPRVKVRLYQEVAAPNGTTGLVFVDETSSSSWDDSLPTNCPGQLESDPFVTYTLGAGNLTKCYDGFHNWNQIQPAVYDGRYRFPSTGYQAAHSGGLPPGKYVVEVLPPTGYEIVKEEDKNILIGDTWVAPVTQQFAGVGNIYILPDQATINAAALAQPAMAFPPCVGEDHIVPDFLSMFPGSGQVAPFAGAKRPLCNRKEVNLNDQMQANADFHLFTPTPVAGHYTGMILDDASAEFNAAAPDFGEKFGVPLVPISIKDFNGVEISRSYADQWGMFNGLTPSTWEPNVPNPSGYAPNMLTTCMNDPGPIMDVATGKMITDPMYNPMYSNFCYTNPFMPGDTAYLDTPVLPVAAFAAGYNHVDCALPDGTPGIFEVDGTGVGPWVDGNSSTRSLTITSMGQVAVPNPAYAGPDPSLGSAPKTILRDFGFGASQGKGTVSIKVPGSSNPVHLTSIVSWSDSQIVVGIPSTMGSTTGELIVTRDNGRSTVNSATVTISNDTPVRVHAGQSIQAAIDAATPGDLILVDPGTYSELLIMWKPVRLQGAGAGSTIINAAKYPNVKLEAWRPRINQLFGIDAAGNQTLPAQVDPLPGQEITGGVVLLEPTVLSTEEGAGITVLAKNLPNGSARNCRASTLGGVSNFLCAPSRIDGISVTGGDSGGGIYVNGWAHNLEIANNRVYGNAGTFTGGVRIGQPNLEGLSGNAAFGFDKNVNIHHNSITTNGTVEANNGQAGGGAGLSMCSGTDNYKVNFNFICGNFSMGDGGGVGHVGRSNGGVIANNWIIFNQSYNQSATVSGGGLVIEGETAAAGGTSLGTGNVTVDSNLIQGNQAGGGHGGGVDIQNLGGDNVTLTNNMIVNNVAGYSGGGISLANAGSARIINNTVASNDSTATVGAVFTTSVTTSTPQPAGISSDTASKGATLRNNIVWENRSFYFAPSAASATKYALYPAITGTGCGAGSGANYWDIGVIGQPQQILLTTPKLNPTYSVLTSTVGYSSGSAHNVAGDPKFQEQYCNGARFVAPGVPDATPSAPPAAFAMQVAGTEDEGGNWIDLRYGPLSLTGNYHINIKPGSPASPALNVASSNGAPNHDFDAQPRFMGAGYDIGADEVPPASVSAPALVFSPVLVP